MLVVNKNCQNLKKKKQKLQLEPTEVPHDMWLSQVTPFGCTKNVDTILIIALAALAPESLLHTGLGRGEATRDC